MPAIIELRLTDGSATTWAAGTAYNVGDRVFPTTRNGYVYECTAAGTSDAATEPIWPTNIGDTVVDGTVTWQCIATEADNSLGGVMSPTAIVSGQLNNVFDDVQPSEATNGSTEYRAIDVYNSGDATATVVEIYMSAETTSVDTQIDIGADTTNSPHLTTDALPTIADETTAPTDGTNAIVFGHYITGSTLALPDIPAGQAVRVWLKRIVNAGATNLANDTGTLTVKYA